MTLQAPIAAPTTYPRFRNIDGSNNAGRDVGRMGRALLSLGGEPVPFDPTREPNPRAVSNVVCQQRPRHTVLDEHNRSEFVWAWGQFLDHELTLVRDEGGSQDILIPGNDPIVEFRNTLIRSKRSERDPDGGIPNGHSPYLDASMVYATEPDRSEAIVGSRGRMKSSPGPDGDLLPYNSDAVDNADNGSRSPEQFFLAGDRRANEHPVLTALHTLLVREHNRICSVIEAREPGIDAEELHQRAAKVVGAFTQAVTFNEFLPALLGPGAIPPYTGFKPAVDPGISNVFATACYRLGHSMVRNEVEVNIANRLLRLEHVFFTPQLVTRLGIEPFLSRLAYRRIARLDTSIVDGLRLSLFRRDSVEMLDLAALNIQRGRDHELPDYNGCRAMFGLAPLSDFAQLTHDGALSASLRRLYGPTMDGLDAWVGALAEAPQQGRLVGDLLHAAIVDQFTRLRDGDWYWFENDLAFSAFDRIVINNTRLSDIIHRNTGLRVPVDVFHVPQRANGYEGLEPAGS